MKRAFDFVVAAAGLAVLSPVLAIIGVIVALDSPGPVLFRQQRVGLGGRPFFIYKFRTMQTRAEQAGPQITASGDARITRAGRWLRRTKIDELPQLLNVLRGDMSFVGPRPEVARYVNLFQDDYREILRVRPGITDLASIEFHDEGRLLASAADPEQHYVAEILPQKIALAKEYVRRQSILLDLRLILATLTKIAGVGDLSRSRT